MTSINWRYALCILFGHRWEYVGFRKRYCRRCPRMEKVNLLGEELTWVEDQGGWPPIPKPLPPPPHLK